MFRNLAALCTIVALVSACAMNKDTKIPPETSYKTGEKLYTKKKYEAAAEAWRKVKESNTSPLLKTIVELRIADALFKDRNYIEAAAEYENFRKLHPKHPKAPYAAYMLALSNFNQVETIDRDHTPIETATKLFEAFIAEYPNQELAKKAQEKLSECHGKQAAYEVYVGRFYYRTEKFPSAISRLKASLERFPKAPVNDEALFLLGSAYLKTGDKIKAKETLAQLLKDYPKSQFTKEAKNLLPRES